MKEEIPALENTVVRDLEGKKFDTRKYFDALKAVISPSGNMSDEEAWKELSKDVAEMSTKMTERGATMIDNLGFSTAEQQPKEEKVEVKSSIMDRVSTLKKIGKEGIANLEYVTDFHDLTDEEIVENLIKNPPKGFEGVIGAENGMRFGKLVEIEQIRKRAQLKAETGNELTKSERLNQVWGGIKNIGAAPVLAGTGALSVFGIYHGLEHAASQGVIGFKKIIASMKGAHFDGKDNSKWYNRANNIGV
jgi:hypothetical protein